jgi:allantoate deiminase
VTRRFGTPAFIEGAQLVESWMCEAGLETRIDSIGNVRGRWNSDKPGAKTFVIASHIDTVVNAGKYDGPLGVVMAIDLIENLKANYRALPFDIEIIAFSDEEGVRFHTTFLGSKVITGTFNKDWLQKKDAEGMSMEDVIRVFGGHAETLSQEAISREKWLGYYEMHIEQGPVLYDKNIPVALVTSIAGQKRIAVSLSGMAGHAGTVPMDKRLDALCAAAECTIAMETFALTEKDRLVVTVGILQIPHSAGNVIPGEVHFTIDIRSGDKPFLDIATKRIQTICAEIVSKRGLDMQWELIQETNPVVTDATLNQLLKNAIIQSEIPIVELVSGAGHDAVPVSQIAPVSMMFIRCYKGISHNPLEQAAINDIAQAIKVSDSFMKNLINHYSSIS